MVQFIVKSSTGRKSSVIFCTSCQEYDDNCVGGTARVLNPPVQEHRQQPEGAGIDCTDSGHSVPWNSIKILACDNCTSRIETRGDLESGTDRPALNRDVGCEVPAVDCSVLIRLTFMY